MTVIYITGEAGTVDFSQATRIAEYLQQNLPDFRADVLCVLPKKWKSFLSKTCKERGWKCAGPVCIWTSTTFLGGAAEFESWWKNTEWVQVREEYDMEFPISAQELRAMAKETLEEAEADEREMFRQRKERKAWRKSVREKRSERRRKREEERLRKVREEEERKKEEAKFAAAMRIMLEGLVAELVEEAQSQAEQQRQEEEEDEEEEEESGNES